MTDLKTAPVPGFTSTRDTKNTRARVKVLMRAVLASVSGAALLAAVAVAGPAAPAQAAGSCSLVVPARMAVSSPYRAVVLKLSAGCAARQFGGWAAWAAYHPTKGAQEFAFFDGTTQEYWDVYDWNTPVGIWTWRADSCYDGASDPCVQNSPKTDIRVAGWAGLSATRSGSYVTVSTSSAHYAYSVSKFVPWVGTRGTIQYRTSSTSPWASLKYVYPNSKGKYSYRYTSSKVRDYRVVFPATSTIWNATSRTTRR